MLVCSDWWTPFLWKQPTRRAGPFDRPSAVLVRAGPARLGRRSACAVRRSCRHCRRRLRLRRRARDAGRGARRGAANWVVACLAVGRRGDGFGVARGARARPPAQTDGCGRPAAHEPAHRPPAHAGRRRRHRPARTRDHPEPRHRLLRRRRRPPGCRVARTRTPRRRAIWTSILYRALAFLHAAEGEGGMRNFMGYDRHWLDFWRGRKRHRLDEFFGPDRSASAMTSPHR